MTSLEAGVAVVHGEVSFESVGLPVCRHLGGDVCLADRIAPEGGAVA